jgi:hypothetical protein
MPTPDRGEVWIVDLGLVGKIRPCLDLNASLPSFPSVQCLFAPGGTNLEQRKNAPGQSLTAQVIRRTSVTINGGKPPRSGHCAPARACKRLLADAGRKEERKNKGQPEGPRTDVAL